MTQKIQEAIDALVNVIDEETKGRVVVVSLWRPTDSSYPPQEDTRILVRNEPGTEIFHTYSSVTRPLFLKYKEWAQIPD